MRSFRDAALVVAALAATAALALAGGPAAAGEAAPHTALNAKGGTLSDKLGKTRGVIAPKGDVDPAMRKPAPAVGTMPVIRPGEVAPGTAK